MSDFSVPLAFENIAKIHYKERAFHHFHLLLTYDIFLRKILQMESILFCQKAIKDNFCKKHPPFAMHQMFQCFVITLLKWMNKYKNRLTFTYYSITLWDFKSLPKCSKNLTSVKSKKKLFSKMSKYQNTVFYDFKSRFLIDFSSNYRDRLVWEIPFPNCFFPKISKYRTGNLCFPSTGKYYAPPPPQLTGNAVKRKV